MPVSDVTPNLPIAHSKDGPKARHRTLGRSGGYCAQVMPTTNTAFSSSAYEEARRRHRRLSRAPKSDEAAYDLSSRNFEEVVAHCAQLISSALDEPTADAHSQLSLIKDHVGELKLHHELETSELRTQIGRLEVTARKDKAEAERQSTSCSAEAENRIAALHAEHDAELEAVRVSSERELHALSADLASLSNQLRAAEARAREEVHDAEVCSGGLTVPATAQPAARKRAHARYGSGPIDEDPWEFAGHTPRMWVGSWG